ncbi:MAG: hypothetical protein KF745_03545 [Phycisphaeraceae bacterium]|nr:hypothetical protein [Phycisphaeraceae bacterium]
MDETERRIERLERSVGRFRALSLAVVVVAAGAAAMGYARGSEGGPPAPIDELRVLRLHVVDEAGRTLVTIGGTASGGVVAVQGVDGALVATLAATRSGSGALALADAKGGRLVEISGRPDGGGGVVNVFGGTGASPSVTLAAEAGNGSVSAYTSEARPSAVLGWAEGASRVVVFGNDGKAAKMLVVDP